MSAALLDMVAWMVLGGIACCAFARIARPNFHYSDEDLANAGAVGLCIVCLIAIRIIVGVTQ